MIKSIAYVLINPIFWVVVLCTLYFILKTLHKYKAAKIFLYSFWGWMLLIYISPLPQFLVGELENEFPEFNLNTSSSQNINILVLGGGVAHARILEGVKIYVNQPNSKLIFSGGSTSKNPTVAERMAGEAVLLGVQPTDTLMNIHPNSTDQEVKAYLKRFDKNDPLILVTSASHMPRAMYNFQIAGINPIPAPTDYRVLDDFGEMEYNFIPSINKMQLMQLAMKEYAGLLWLRMTS